jgi:hypothetical protein
LGLLNQKLIISLVQNIAVFSTLFKDQHRAFSIVHETGAVIDPMTESIQQGSSCAHRLQRDLAGDGGSDERRAPFSQQIKRSLDLRAKRHAVGLP